MHRLLFLLPLLVGCSCGDELADLRVEGRYVRCFAADAPETRSWRHGAVELRSDGRALTLSGIEAPARLALGTGPLDEAAAAALREVEPDVVLLLGPLPESVPEFSFPVLLLPGGSDRPNPELADGAGIIDASPYRTVSVAGVELVLVPGAPEGRYALDEDRCGFGDDDVDAWEQGEAARVLVSWAAPTGVPGLEGAESGSALVARIAERTGAEGAVFAWPYEAAGMHGTEPLRIGVRPLSGPLRVAASGAPVPSGPTVLALSEEGVQLASDSP